MADEELSLEEKVEALQQYMNEAQKRILLLEEKLDALRSDLLLAAYVQAFTIRKESKKGKKK